MNHPLEIINMLVDKYKYKPLPKDLSHEAREYYIYHIPQFLSIDGVNMPLYTSKGTLLCSGYERIVVGDYGAYIEFSHEQANRELFVCAPGQEYRYEERYRNNVKYNWLTIGDGSNCKIYEQLRPVKYADYKPGMYYVSVYEAFNDEI